MHLPEYIKRILDVYSAAGYRALAVGGCVRDTLLGAEPDDYDIATDALPHETKELFKAQRIIETGIKHGTLTIMCEDHPVEVTVFRKDGAYTDNRRPDSVIFSRTFAEDAARRDFTVNAMGYSPNEGLIDLYGGSQDLQNGIIRAVGDPEQRFKEDGLRIMRAIRFASTLGFTLDEETERAALKCKALLLNISKERIFIELQKLIMGKNCKEALLKYSDIIGTVCPSILPMKGFEQNNPYHKYDVLTHTAVALAEVKNTPLLKWVTLFHDAGKPLCYTCDEKGGHFYGHAKISADIAKNALADLKAPSALTKAAVNLIAVHDIPLEPTERFVKRQLNRLGEETFFNLIDFQRADNAAQSERVAYRREIFDRVAALARETVEKSHCFSLKDLAVKGDDLIAIGIPQGKDVGRTLSVLLEKVMDGSLENEKEILIKHIKNIQNGELTMDLKNILSKVDHTILKTDATFEDVKKVLDEAMEYGTASACIPSCYVKQAAEYMGDKGVVCTVVGFPNGYSTTEAKCLETAQAVKEGAGEIDMVINHGMVREGRYDDITKEINEVKKACDGKLLKVIIETCIHSEEEKIALCKAVAASDAEYIKTSTGFSTHGATREDVALLVKYCTGKLVKAAGGIKTLQDAEDFIALGASRLGTSSVIKAVKEL